MCWFDLNIENSNPKRSFMIADEFKIRLEERHKTPQKAFADFRHLKGEDQKSCKLHR